MKKKLLLTTFRDILIGAVVVNLVWLLAALLLDLPALTNPITVYRHIGDVCREGMSTHLLASSWRIFPGISIALGLALIVALLMFRYKIVGRILGAVVYFSYPIPKLALLPVVMLLAGLGDTAKVTMIVLIIVFQLIVTIRDSLRQIPPDNFRTLTALGASEAQILRHLIIPAITPDILSALRVAVGTAISVLFVTETYGTGKGMGYFIVDAWMRIDYPDMYAGIVLLSLLGFFLFLILDLVEKALTPWRR